MVTNLSLVPSVVVLFSLLGPQQDAQKSANGQRHEQEAVKAESTDASHAAPAAVIGIGLGIGRTQPTISSLIPGGPAEAAGLKPGAVIVGVDNEPIADTVAFVVAIRAHKPGDTVAITLASEEVLDVKLGSWRDILNQRFAEFRIDGTTRLSKATLCGLELADTQIPHQSLSSARDENGVLVVDTQPESEAALQPFGFPFPFGAGDIISSIDGNRVENIVDLVIALLGTGNEHGRVRFVFWIGHEISSGKNVTGTYPLRLPPACLEDLRRIHASLSSKDNEPEREE